MKGTVKFYNTKKGYGFITADDQTEYFVHISGIAQGVVLDKDIEVEFDVAQGERGPYASNVRLAGSTQENDSDDSSDDDSDDDDDQQD